MKSIVYITSRFSPTNGSVLFVFAKLAFVALLSGKVWVDGFSPFLERRTTFAHGQDQQTNEMENKTHNKETGERHNQFALVTTIDQFLIPSCRWLQ